MGTGRRRHSSAFKAQVALEGLKGDKTLNELAAEYGVHPVQIAQWKKHALEGMPTLFEGGGNRREQADQAVIAQLSQEIGQLKIERDWLRKKGLMPIRRDAD
jgi:transposase-like protein